MEVILEPSALTSIYIFICFLILQSNLLISRVCIYEPTIPYFLEIGIYDTKVLEVSDFFTSVRISHNGWIKVLATLLSYDDGEFESCRLLCCWVLQHFNILGHQRRFRQSVKSQTNFAQRL